MQREHKYTKVSPAPQPGSDEENRHSGPMTRSRVKAIQSVPLLQQTHQSSSAPTGVSGNTNGMQNHVVPVTTYAKEYSFLQSQQNYHARDERNEKLRALAEVGLTIIALVLLGVQMSQKYVDVHHDDDQSGQHKFNWYTDSLNILAALSFFSSVGYKAYVTHHKINHMRQVLSDYKVSQHSHDKKLMKHRYQLLIKLAVKAIFSDSNGSNNQDNDNFAAMLEPYYLDYFTKEYLKFDSMDKLEARLADILDPAKHQSRMLNAIWVVPPLVFLSLIVILLVQSGMNLLIPREAAAITAFSFALALAVTNLFSHLLDHSTRLPATQVLNALNTDVQSLEAIEEGSQNSIDKLKEQLGQTELEQYQINLEQLTQAEVVKMSDRSQNVQLFKGTLLPNLEKAKATMFGHVGLFFAKNALFTLNQQNLQQMADDFKLLKALLKKKKIDIEPLLHKEGQKYLTHILSAKANVNKSYEKEHEELQEIFQAIPEGDATLGGVKTQIKDWLNTFDKLQLRKLAYNSL